MEMNPITTGKKRASISQKQVAALFKSLEAAQPPARDLTLTETLEELSSQLIDAKQRGHTAESIAAVLNAQGLDVQARSIKLALRKSSPRRTHLSLPRKHPRAASASGSAPADQSQLSKTY
jgi:hypothetical protein